MNHVPAFWLRGHDQRQENSNPQWYDVFRCALLHTLLYEARLVYSDSDAINSRNFRTAMAHDDTFRNLYKAGLIRIACRGIGANHSAGITRQPLTKTYEEFRDPTKSKRPTSYDESEYNDDSAITFLEHHGNLGFVTYSFDEVSLHFSSEVESIFRKDGTRQLLQHDQLTDFIIERIVERKKQDQKNKIGLKYLWEESVEGQPALGAELNRKFGSDTWSRYQENIRKIAAGPYFTALPSVHGMNPVFDADQEHSIQLWRGRYSSAVEPLGAEDTVKSVIGVDTYVSGLKQLTYDDILKIREGDAWTTYAEWLSKGVRNEDELNGFRGAYQAHRIKIEECIAAKLKTSTGKKEDVGKVNTKWVLSPGAAAEWVVHEVADWYFGPLSKLYSFGQAIFQRLKPLNANDPRDLAILKQQAEIEQARENLGLKETEQPEGRVQHRTVVHRPDVRDTCTRTSRGS